jgi:hypothetical protein
MITLKQFRQTINDRFGGVIRSGSHQPNGQACALEAYSVAIGKPWTDHPFTLGMPDVRRLNDARWSNDKARTDGLLPVVVALSRWSEWTKAQRSEWASRVVLRTVLEIISESKWIPEKHRKALRAVTTLDKERAACKAAATATDATDAATAAAAADAAYAAYAAANDAADRVLSHACRIWTEEAEKINTVMA